MSNQHDYERLLQIKNCDENCLVVGKIRFAGCPEPNHVADIVVLDQYLVALRFGVTYTARTILERSATTYTPLDRDCLDQYLQFPVREGMIAAIVSFIDNHFEADVWNWRQAYAYGELVDEGGFARLYMVYPPADEPDPKHIGQTMFFKRKHAEAWIEFEVGEETVQESKRAVFRLSSGH